MKVVEAYQCEICESVYNSIEECKKCENDCSDRCNYENAIVLFDDGNDSVISIEYNYDYYGCSLDSEDKFLLRLNDESVSLTLEDVSKISKMLLDAKEHYTSDLMLKKFYKKEERVKMHKYMVVIYHNGIAVESWLTEARTKKGIEKKYKQKFKEYKQQNYTYKVFSEESE